MVGKNRQILIVCRFFCIKIALGQGVRKRHSVPTDLAFLWVWKRQNLLSDPIRIFGRILNAFLGRGIKIRCRRPKKNLKSSIGSINYLEMVNISRRDISINASCNIFA